MRLINADELMELYDGCDGLSVPIAVVQQNIKDATTVDAEPVRHGRWIEKGYVCGETEYQCSECKETEWRTSASRLKYCPFCGAKMDGGKVK